MRVATDIGGTFTDLVAVDDNGKIIVGKSDTTPNKFEKGIFNVIEQANIDLKDIQMFFHGTTVVINTLTEKTGVKTGLITTKGFRDVLEIARGNRPDLFNLKYKKPEPIVERHLRKEISERLDYKGEVISPLNTDELNEILTYFKEYNVKAIAVSLLHSYKNDEHEKQVLNYIRTNYPEFSVTISSELSKEWREYERTSTAAFNAYVKPIAHDYLTNLEQNLIDKSSCKKNYIMQSNGGTSTFEIAKKTPINMIESGPVAGIFGASILGEVIDENNLIVLDIGGTTAKCSLVENGNVKISTNYHMEKTERYAGYPLKVPVVDIIEIGNGGGSIAWIDDSGSIKVGPKSAGADPGPIAYGRGGNKPTTTDANILLGRLALRNFETSTSLEEIKNKFEISLGKQLNTKTDDLAMGIVKIANSNMLNALKLISVRKGYDPRDFTLVAIGGGGPMHSQALARELGIKKVVIPSTSSVFASWGMLMSDIRHDYSQTLLLPARGISYKEVNSVYDEIIRKAEETLNTEGVEASDVVITKSLDMRYEGQEHTVEIHVPYENIDENNIEEIIKNFHENHDRMYSYTLPENELEIVNIKIQALGKLEKPKMIETDTEEGTALKEEREVFYEESGWIHVSVYDKNKLKVEESVTGPAIIEEQSTSIILHDGDVLQKDKYGNLVIEIGGQ
ncbi:hydantoinase/oxoprolinase family protein [Jeotgalicoccus halotolerans]|uniref:N-methylhydantoinase A n=1 Tax=Jeotgalicoccus halotolerans TaxID=157227 RepID=A0A3E0AUQ7_9STAP|nr:hydantoinase/oxoprolinase family protein [Jeotgalicoccus halotolerans]REG23498.1 N-methylhydantoinase A [Jeotgalicoccus halotolerans]